MHIRNILLPFSLLAGLALADETTTGVSGCLLYAVQANDTGYSIAKSFGMEFPLINASNPTMAWEKIKIGEQVLIPIGYTLQPSKGVTSAPACPAGAVSPAADTAPAGIPSLAVASDMEPDAEPHTELGTESDGDSEPVKDQVSSLVASVASLVALVAPAATSGRPESAKLASAPLSTGSLAVTSSIDAAVSTPGTIPSAAPAPASAAAPTAGCHTYTVAKGDTGYNIAVKNGVTMAQMNALNPGMVWEKMQEKQILVLPPTANGTGLTSNLDCKPAVIIPAAAAGNASASASAPPPSKPVASGAPTGTAVAPAAASSKPAASPAPLASGAASSAPASGKAISSGGAEPVSVIKHIVRQSESCASAKFKDECATATEAAPHIVASFAQYGITTAGEQAALLSWMIFESAGFQFNRNHFPEPGRPGQGTRTMMMPDFVAEYAKSITALNTAGVTDPDALLKLVMVPEYTFGAAAWFHSTKCDQETKKGAKDGTTAGWELWLSKCVVTEIGEGGPDGRRAIYDKAREALGVAIA